MARVWLLIGMLLMLLKVQAQYFRLETALLKAIRFNDPSVDALYKKAIADAPNAQAILKRLKAIPDDSLNSLEDQASFSILKSLDGIEKGYEKTALLEAISAERYATKSEDSRLMNHSNLLQAMISLRQHAGKNAIKWLNLCHYQDAILNYQVNYLKAETYFEIGDYDNANLVLIDLMPVSKTISSMDYVKSLSLLISNASRNNDDALSLIYALKLDTVLTQIQASGNGSRLLNPDIDYKTTKNKNTDSYLMMQRIINTNNIGFLYRKLSDYGSSEKYLLRSISELKKYKNDELFPEVKTNIGLTYTHLKKYSEADTYYQQALKYYIEARHERKQAELYNIIAKNDLLSNKSPSSIEYCHLAIELAVRNKDYLTEANSYFILSEVYALNSDYQQSQNYFKLFTDTKNKHTQALNEEARLRNDKESKAILAQVEAEDEIFEREKKSLELVKIKLESRQKEQELRLIRQENELKEKTITAQALEKQEALRSLELIKGQLENERLQQEYEKINKEKEIKGLENEKNKNKIKFLNSEKKIFMSEQAIKDLEIQNTKKKQFYLTLTLVLVGFFLALISFGFYKNYRQKKVIEVTNARLEESVDEINEQKKIIQTKNTQIIDSINYSLRIQQSFLFKEHQMIGYFKDCFIISRPRDIVSGDFYLVTRKADKIYMAVVDCTGHGVPGALISVIGHEEIRHLIEYNSFSLSSILEKLNVKINDTLNSDNAFGSDGMDLMLIEVDTTQKQITFCGARSVCYFYTNNQFLEIKGDRKSIGSREDSGDTRFTEHCYAYGNDDILYLFTDGFSDQFGAEGKKKMGSKLFRTNLIQVKDLPMNLQKTKMEELLENWQGNAKQTDDITLLGIRL